jgi:hypothetical protein
MAGLKGFEPMNAFKLPENANFTSLKQGKFE